MSTQNFVEHLKRGAQRDADMIVKEAELTFRKVQKTGSLSDMRMRVLNVMVLARKAEH